MIDSAYQSVADRDGMIESGMERGANESHGRLDEPLAKTEEGGAGSAAPLRR